MKTIKVTEDKREVKRVVLKRKIIIKGIEIDVRTESCLYVTIGNWKICIDNSTNERFIDHWTTENNN